MPIWTHTLYAAMTVALLRNAISSALADSLTQPSARVINGEPVTDATEYPFAVDLSFDDVAISSSRFCTGSLIGKDIVLTAAHCALNQATEGAMFATVARVELSDEHVENRYARTFRAVAAIVHPLYNGVGSPDDVAVLLLNASSQTRFVSLAAEAPPIGQVGWVVGYGVQMRGTLEQAETRIELLSGRLQKTALRIMEPEFCNVREVGMTTARGMLCTRGVNKGSTACKGDSGGGLFTRGTTDDQAVQVGVVSYGDARCGAKDAGVFTDVASVKGWIDQATRRLHAAFDRSESPQDSSVRPAVRWMSSPKSRGSTADDRRYGKLYDWTRPGSK